MSIKSKSLHAAAILSVLFATTSPSMAASTSYGPAPSTSSNNGTTYKDVQNPWGDGTMLRQYANGSSIAFYQKTVYYKFSQYEEWNNMQATTLDSICNCYNQAAAAGTNINVTSGRKVTQEEYYSSEVFYNVALASVETMYPAYFPGGNQFANQSDIFQPKGLYYLMPRMSAIISQIFGGFGLGLSQSSGGFGF